MSNNKNNGIDANAFGSGTGTGWDDVGTGAVDMDELEAVFVDATGYDPDGFSETAMRDELRPERRRSRGGGSLVDEYTAELIEHLEAPSGSLVTGDGVEGEEIDTQTAGELWESARKAYTSAQNPGISKATARMRATRALEKETTWMDVKRSTQTDDPQDLWWHDEDEGRYVQNVSRIKDRMVDELGGEATATEVNHVKHFLQARNGVDDDEINAGNAEDTLLPFSNGVMNISEVARSWDEETGIDVEAIELEDAMPGQRWTYQIDTAWDPNGADTDGFDEWLSAICPDEHDRRVYTEFAGHAIHPGYPVDGFMMVRGPGGSGKSQAVEVIGHAIGEESVGRSKLHKIEGNRFETAQVVDKTVNIDKDLEGTKLDTMSKLKHLAAGEEMSCELKGVDAYKAINSATMIMAADNPPQFPDGNKKSLGRRLYSVEFPCEFVDKPDPDNPYELQHRPKIEIEEELRSDERCKALIVRAIGGLARLLATGRFSSPYSWEERIERYESHADPVADSVRTLLVRDTNGTIHGADFKAAYDRLAQAKHHPEKSQQAILQTAQRFVYTTMEKNRTRTFTPGRERDTVYHGMAWSEEAKEKYLPEDAHWDQMNDDYADYHDVETPDQEIGDEQRDAAPVACIDAGDGQVEETIRVTVVAQAEDPSYGWDDQGTLKDSTDAIRYKIENGTALIEGATYEISDVIACEFEGARVLHIVPGLTDIEMVTGTNDDGDTDDDDASDIINAGDDVDPRDVVYDAVDELEGTHDEGAPVVDVIERVQSECGIDDEDKIEHVMTQVEHSGRVYEPASGYLRAT